MSISIFLLVYQAGQQASREKEEETRA